MSELKTRLYAHYGEQMKTTKDEQGNERYDIKEEYEDENEHEITCECKDGKTRVFKAFYVDGQIMVSSRETFSYE